VCVCVCVCVFHIVYIWSHDMCTLLLVLLLLVLLLLGNILSGTTASWLYLIRNNFTHYYQLSYCCRSRGNMAISYQRKLPWCWFALGMHGVEDNTHGVEEDTYFCTLQVLKTTKTFIHCMCASSWRRLCLLLSIWRRTHTFVRCMCASSWRGHGIGMSSFPEPQGLTRMCS